MVEIVVLVVALMAGLLAKKVNMPPMVGFLVAGFVLASSNTLVPGLAELNFKLLEDLGVNLLLFTIGLKLDLRSLMRPFVWAVNCIHMPIVVLVVALLLFMLKTLGWGMLADMSVKQGLTIGFALSFSSTVFAVKMLEERGEMASLHGKAAIGILVMQDFCAVVYICVMSAELPSMYALLLLLLIPARGLMVRLLKRCGHDELLVLAGFAIAYGGYVLSESVGLKGGLGALCIGAVLAGSEKGNELAKSLLTIKDLLLIGFFLSIGQHGLPSDDAWLMAILLALCLLFKPLLYFVLFSRFKLRTQTALSASLSLNHYSEFGLIVMSIAVAEHVLPESWLVTVALAIALSFVMSALINNYSGKFYARWSGWLGFFETEERLPEQQPINIGSARILVMGMGRLGSGAYDYLQEIYGDAVIGFEESSSKTEEHVRLGRRVLTGDASDRDLWERLPKQQIDKVLLALSNHRETVMVAEILRECGFTGVVTAVARFKDDLEALRAMGVVAFDFYDEAGSGFAERVVNSMNRKVDPEAV